MLGLRSDKRTVIRVWFAALADDEEWSILKSW